MPTLGEIAQYQDSLLKGMPEPGQGIKTVGAYQDFFKKRDELEKGRREMDSDAFKKQTDVVTRIIGNPAWEKQDVAGINDAINAAEADARAQRIPVSADGPLNRLRKKVNAGDIAGGYQDISDLVRGGLGAGEKATAVIPNRVKGPATGTDGTTKPNDPANSANPAAPAAAPFKPTFIPTREKAVITSPDSQKETTQETANAKAFSDSRTALDKQWGGSAPVISNIDNVIKESDRWIKEADFDSKGWFGKNYKGWTGNEPSSQGGWGGQLRRNIIAKFKLDEDYQLQGKNIANIILTQSAILGGTTNEGKELIAQANGTITMSPWNLKKIAEQAKADQVHINYRAEAASKFAQKYGDREGQGFNKMWNDNADRTVFQGLLIGDDPKLSNAEKIKKITELWGPPGSDSYDKYQRKADNIDILKLHGTL